MRSILLFLICLMSFNVSANVIIFPENITVLSVNGIEQSSHFFARETQIEFSTGNQVVVLKYQDLFEGDDDHTKVKSKPFVVLFTLNELLNAKNKIMAVTPRIEELSQAKAFAKNPKVKLLMESGKEIASVNQSLIKFNAQGQFVKLTHNNKSAKLNESVIANSQTINKHNMLKEKCSDNRQQAHKVSSIERLKCLWNKANKAEKEAFLHYISAQQ
ncbi:DUF2057 family protein [Cognaticolwellia mytili]|uniref:DUF2057 family protein n=1 Tax=Cognaticolwellia mytili TaxID=1888913 RepID=UPI000A17400E|nr:DUF2057 family protein [Cognaticolwellia mytili]